MFNQIFSLQKVNEARLLVTNNLRFRILGNQEVPGKLQNYRIIA